MKLRKEYTCPLEWDIEGITPMRAFQYVSETL